MANSGPVCVERLAFFAEQNRKLLEELRKKTEKEERREALRRIAKIKDDAFLERLIAFDIGPEKALALRLVPLIFVAWADGHLDEREREAVLRSPPPSRPFWTTSGESSNSATVRFVPRALTR